MLLVFYIDIHMLVAGPGVGMCWVHLAWQVLTIYAGRETAGRRSSPVPQLECRGTVLALSHRPSTYSTVDITDNQYLHIIVV